MKKAMVLDIQRYSIHDGPGIRTTIFLKGCHMKCAWCHNPESQRMEAELMYFEKTCIGCRKCEDICHKNAHTFFQKKHEMKIQICRKCDKMKLCEEVCCSNSIRCCGFEMSAENMLKEMMRDQEFYGLEGGVTFSGGEPLLQHAFLQEMMVLCKDKNLPICLDTTLNVEWSIIQKLLPYIDCFLVDIKCMDEGLHKQLTGQSNKKVLENLKHLSDAGANIIIRVPLVLGCNDSQSETQQRNDFLKQIKGIERIDLLPVSNHAKEKYKALGRTITNF